MNGPRRQGGISDELQPYVDAGEAEAIDRLGERLLERERPLPSAGFRSQVRASLYGSGRVRTEWRPKRLRVLVAAYAGSGAALMAIAAIGLGGAGPLGY